MSQPLQRRVPSQEPEAFDAADRERAVVLRRMTIAFIAFVVTLRNPSLDWTCESSDDGSSGSESASEVDYEEILATSVESVVERIQELGKLIDECQGRLASDHYVQPLPYVLAEAMCKAMNKFLDSKKVAVAALELITKMWDSSLLDFEFADDIPGMPDFQVTLNDSVLMSIKLFRHDWLEASTSWSTLGSMTNIGPDRFNQVQLDQYLATARGLMEADIKCVRVHEVVQCAVLLDSVVFWQLMCTAHEEYYTQFVGKFALWLVNTFKTTVQADQHAGVLGCKLLYRITIGNMELGQAQDPVQFTMADEWFRRHKIPERLMLFQGFSVDGDKYIREIMRRVPLAGAGPAARAA